MEAFTSSNPDGEGFTSMSNHFDLPASRNAAQNIGTSEGPTNVDEGSPDQGTQSDQVGHGLKLWADVGIELGSKVAKLGEQVESLSERLQHNTPVDFQLVASGQIVTGTPLLLVLGSPDLGTYWEVTQTAFGGLDYTTTAAGGVGLYVAAMPTLASASLMNLEDFWAAMPNATNYGTRQLVVNDNEYLMATINGGTNGQTYIGRASVTVWRDVAQRGKSDIIA